MHISDTGRLDRLDHAVDADANAKRLAWWVQVAAMVPVAFLYVIVALLSCAALQQSGADVAWTPLG